jgi:hypothetical protein
MVIIEKGNRHHTGCIRSMIPLTFNIDTVMSELNAVQKGSKVFTLTLEDIKIFMALCLKLGSFHYRNPGFNPEDTNISICGGYVGSKKEDGRTRATRIELRIVDVINGKCVKIPPSIIIYRVKATNCAPEYPTEKSYTAHMRWGSQNNRLRIPKIKYLHRYPMVSLSDNKMPLYINTPYLNVYAKECLAGKL